MFIVWSYTRFVFLALIGNPTWLPEPIMCSNLGTFWLKIEQFWPFEEISIFSNGGHLGYRTALTDTILKRDRLRIISAKFGWDWLSSFRGEDFFLNLIPFFSIFLLGGHFGWNSASPATFLEENHPMTISSKFCSYWANGFRQDFYGNFP